MNDKEFLQQILDNQNKFWSQEYPKLSLEEKKKYWLASTHRGMRSQGEALGDEYTEFSKNGMILPKKMSLILMRYLRML